MFAFNSKDNFEIRNLVVDCNDLNKSAGIHVNGITVNNSTNFKIIGMEVMNASQTHGITIYSGCKNGLVAHCYLHDNKGSGVDMYLRNENISVTDNLMENNYAAGVTSEGATNVINDNTINRNILITNNVIRSTYDGACPNWGIEVLGTYGGIVSNNVIKDINRGFSYDILSGTPGAIISTGNDMLIIEGNVITDNNTAKYGGIFNINQSDRFSGGVYSNRLIIKNNILVNTRGGIHVSACHGLTLSDNIMKNNVPNSTGGGYTYTDYYIAFVDGAIKIDQEVHKDFSDYQNVPSNLIPDPYFLIWPNGYSAPPGRWQLLGTGASVMKETTIIKYGSSSANPGLWYGGISYPSGYSHSATDSYNVGFTLTWWGTAAPTSGTWNRGDVVYNTQPFFGI